MLTYTNATPDDLARLQNWVAADEFHKDTLSGEFWIPQPDVKGVKWLTVSDENGAVFNLRLENAMRVFVQFPPEPDVERTKNALKEAFAFISAGAKRLGYHEMLFDSVSKPLIRFFSKFGFKPMANTFKVGI